MAYAFSKYLAIDDYALFSQRALDAVKHITWESLVDRLNSGKILVLGIYMKKSVSLPPPKTKLLHNVRKSQVFLWSALYCEEYHAAVYQTQSKWQSSG